jgi:hypothetical protein
VEKSFPKRVIGTLIGAAIGGLAIVGVTGAIAGSTACLITGVFTLATFACIFSGPPGWIALGIAACIGASLGAVIGNAISASSAHAPASKEIDSSVSSSNSTLYSTSTTVRNSFSNFSESSNQDNQLART